METVYFYGVCYNGPCYLHNAKNLLHLICLYLKTFCVVPKPIPCMLKPIMIIPESPTTIVRVSVIAEYIIYIVLHT